MASPMTTRARIRGKQLDSRHDGGIARAIGNLEEMAEPNCLGSGLFGKVGGQERGKDLFELLERGIVEKAKLAVVADVEHRLGLAGVRAAAEERAVEGL